MRRKEEISKEANESWGSQQRRILEVLLDIRDILLRKEEGD